jgi:hypothetical protein
MQAMCATYSNCTVYAKDVTVYVGCFTTRRAVDSAFRYGGKIGFYCGMTSRSVEERNCDFDKQTAAFLFREYQFCVWTALCWRRRGSTSFSELYGLSSLAERPAVFQHESWYTDLGEATNRFAVDMSCQCLHKPTCWRHVVSVYTQTDLLETCVNVYTDAITVKESHLVFISGGKCADILKTFTLKMKAGCFSEACRPTS